MPQYRVTLVASFLTKFYWQSKRFFEGLDAVPMPVRSLLDDLGQHEAAPKAVQTYDALDLLPEHTVNSVGGSVVHRSGAAPWDLIPPPPSRCMPSRSHRAHSTANVGRGGGPGYQQATGEAKYLDDYPARADELFAVPVGSTQAHARILAIDASAALGAVVGKRLADQLYVCSIWFRPWPTRHAR
jgi:hypothetical protein